MLMKIHKVVRRVVSGTLNRKTKTLTVPSLWSFGLLSASCGVELIDLPVLSREYGNQFFRDYIGIVFPYSLLRTCK